MMISYRALLFLTLLAFPLSVFGQKRFFGAETSFKSDIAAPGIGLSYGGIIGTPKFRAVHNYSIYLPETTSFTSNGVDFSAKNYYWELSTSAHYIVELSEQTKLYPILAMYLRGAVRTREGGGQQFSDTQTRIGPTVGLGYEHQWKELYLFSEAVYTVYGFNQVRINAGIRIPFEKRLPPPTGVRNED